MANSNYTNDSTSTPSSLNIAGLVHNPGSVITPNKIKYTIQVVLGDAGVLYINRSVSDSDDTERERAVSWFTAQETMGTLTVDTDA